MFTINFVIYFLAGFGAIAFCMMSAIIVMLLLRPLGGWLQEMLLVYKDLVYRHRIIHLYDIFFKPLEDDEGVLRDREGEIWRMVYYKLKKDLENLKTQTNNTTMATKETPKRQQDNEKPTINITNNFNAPIGQHIDHVDTVNFTMDKDGNFRFENVGKTVGTKISELSAVDERVKQSIGVLQQEKVLANQYDYTWLMALMNEKKDMPSFKTPSSYVSYLKGLQIGRCPSESLVSKYLNKFSGIFPDWEFIDCDITEANRRINVAKRFLNLYSGMTA